MLFPTDLTSFLDLIRQHGDAAYSFMFAYAASHSLLLALFAGYAAHSGSLSLGTVIVACWFGSFTGDVIRFWIGRRYGARLLDRFPRFERTVQTVVRDPVILSEPLVRSQSWVLDPTQQMGRDICETVPEIPKAADYVPHHLPGTNPFLHEVADWYGLPAEATRGGAETMYPEYMLKMKTMAVLPRPAKKAPPP